MTKRETVVFTHIPKVAGTSLIARLIQTNYGPDEIRHFRGIKDLVVRRTGHKLLIGHNPFGMGDFIPGEIRSFTMLRDPVARAISHFYFIRQPALNPLNEGNQDQKALHRNVRLKDIFERTRHQRWYPATSWLMDNLQTRYTAGYRHNWRSEKSSVLLATAKKNLRENYHVFGIQDKFEMSLSVIADSFGWTIGPPVNRARVTRIEKDYDEEDLEVVRRHNQLDQELFDYASELFAERFGQNTSSEQARPATDEKIDLHTK